jgi:hypothetical protein
MQNWKSDSSSAGSEKRAADGAALEASRKAHWHPPVFKRLDVDLTATQVRTSNEGPTGQTHFSS